MHLSHFDVIEVSLPLGTGDHLRGCWGGLWRRLRGIGLWNAAASHEELRECLKACHGVTPSSRDCRFAA